MPSAFPLRPLRLRGRFFLRTKKNGGAKQCLAPPCPAQPERIRTRAAPHEPAVTRWIAKALRSPSPGRAVAGKRSRTRVPDRVATSSLLPRTRRVPVPSGPAVQALRGPCVRRFPTKLRSGSVHPLGLGAHSTWSLRERPRPGRTSGTLRPRVLDCCGSSVSSRSGAGPTSSRGRASRARSSDSGRSRMERWLPSPASRSDGSQVPACPSDDARLSPATFGSSAIPEGPVALRPSLAAGLPLSCHRWSREPYQRNRKRQIELVSECSAFTQGAVILALASLIGLCCGVWTSAAAQ